MLIWSKMNTFYVLIYVITVNLVYFQTMMGVCTTMSFYFYTKQMIHEYISPMNNEIDEVLNTINLKNFKMNLEHRSTSTLRAEDNTS